MNHRLRIHPVDLQDHDGFLTFLQEEARRGYTAVRVFRTCTLFQRTKIPPQGYTLWIVPPGEEDPFQGPTIPTARPGVRLAPVPEPASEETRTWEQDLTDHYDSVAPANIYSLIRRGELAVVFPIGFWVLVTFRLHVSPAQMDTLIGLTVLLFCAALFGFCAEALALAAERLHLYGLRAALAAGTRYRPWPWLTRFTPVKNTLQMASAAGNLLVLLAAIFTFLGT